VKRLILSKLLDWKNSPYRKPLIFKGVRQVGKPEFSRNLADVAMKIRPTSTSMKTWCNIGSYIVFGRTSGT
jgi:hypothetical protein